MNGGNISVTIKANTSVPGLMIPIRKGLSTVLAFAFALSLGLYGSAGATVNVSFSSSAPASLQTDFIAAATNQYLGVITKSPYFSNTWALLISGINPNYQPPVVSSPIPTATAVDQCMTYGFSNGMDEERWQSVNQIYAMQGIERSSDTCSFVNLNTSTTPWLISTTTLKGFCMSVYSVVASSISERWGYVFTPTGQRVAP